MWRYVHVRGETFGPADTERLAVWLREGRLGPDDWVWIEEEGRWEVARQVADLVALVPEVFAGAKGGGTAHLSAAVAAPGLGAPSSTVPPGVERKADVPENLFAFEGARRYIRFETHLHAQYCAVGGHHAPRAGDWHKCTVSNLSVGGAGIETVSKIADGTTLRFRFHLPDGRPDPIETNAEVMRSAPSVRSGFTEYGLRFSSMPQPMKKRLVEFLETLVAQKG